MGYKYLQSPVWDMGSYFAFDGNSFACMILNQYAN